MNESQLAPGHDQWCHEYWADLYKSRKCDLIDIFRLPCEDPTIENAIFIKSATAGSLIEDTIQVSSCRPPQSYSQTQHFLRKVIIPHFLRKVITPHFLRKVIILSTRCNATLTTRCLELTYWLVPCTVVLLWRRGCGFRTRPLVWRYNEGV